MTLSRKLISNSNLLLKPKPQNHTLFNPLHSNPNPNPNPNFNLNHNALLFSHLKPYQNPSISSSFSIPNFNLQCRTFYQFIRPRLFSSQSQSQSQSVSESKSNPDISNEDKNNRDLSLRICTICNFACNTETEFAQHLAHRKHIVREQALRPRTHLKPISISNPETESEEKTTVESKNGRSLWCELCETSCTSSNELVIHILGKNHRSNLIRLRMKVIRWAKGIQSKEPMDVNTKIQKVLQSGTPVGVRACTICHVVCNSEKTFIEHVKGRKHGRTLGKIKEHDAMAKQGKVGVGNIGLLSEPKNSKISDDPKTV